MKIRRTRRPHWLAAFLLLLGPWLRPAMAQLLGPELQVNTFTTDHQSNAAVAADNAGNFVVVWQGRAQDGSFYGVFGQRFDSAGSKVGSEFQVNSYTTNNQRNPSVARESSGSLVVVWDSYLQDGLGSAVIGQRYASGGSAVGSEFQVNTYTTDLQWYPSVAAVGSGNFVVVWESVGQDGIFGGVFAQRYDSAGSKAGSEFRVNTFTTNNQRYPAVAADGSEGFVVVWQSHVQDGSSWGVFGQRYDFTGSRVGSEFQVNSFTTGYQMSPAVAADSSDNFVVAWTSDAQDGSGYGVFGQRFNSLGSKVGSEFQVNSYTTSYQTNPFVAKVGAGDFVVAWSSRDQDGAGFGAFGQRFNSAGSPVGSEFQVNSYTTDTQGVSAVAADGAGNFVVVWNSYGQDGAQNGVFGRQVMVSVFKSNFTAIPPFWSDTTTTTCTGFCGSATSPDGICFCDTFCLTNKDCCLDACKTCKCP